jgi:hypothetical protein
MPVPVSQPAELGRGLVDPSRVVVPLHRVSYMTMGLHPWLPLVCPSEAEITIPIDMSLSTVWHKFGVVFSAATVGCGERSEPHPTSAAHAHRNKEPYLRHGSLSHEHCRLPLPDMPGIPHLGNCGTTAWGK